jgi:hypothetical protein
VSPSSTASALAPRFAALRARDYRRYFALGLVSMTADNIEHVISYWVIFQAFLNTAMLGLRAGSGLTIGLVGALISVEWSLALSALVVVVIVFALLGRESRRLDVSRRAPGGEFSD